MPDTPNLDAMSADDLVTWAAKQEDDARVAQRLALYARCKAQAMNARERGAINVALAYEKACNLAYEELPAEARW